MRRRVRPSCALANVPLDIGVTNSKVIYSPGLAFESRVHFDHPYVSVLILLVGTLKMKIYPGARLKSGA